MNELKNYNETSVRSIFQTGFKKMHDAFNIKTHMPKEYYDGVKGLFSNYSEELFILVVKKLVLEYRSYQMPAISDYRTAIFEVKQENRQFKAKPLFIDEVAASETDKEVFARMVDEYKRNHPSKKKTSHGLQMVQARHQRIRILIASGKEYCDIDHKWVNKVDFTKVAR